MGVPVFPVDCIAFCDESKYVGSERFRAVSCVAVSSSNFVEVEDALRKILEEAKKSDLGFEDLRTARDCIVATKLMRCAVEFASLGVLKIRTIIWDAYDARHGPGTDQLANFQRMYVHLLRDVLARRWSANSWEIRPDEQTAVLWNRMSRILEAAASKTAGRPIEVRHLEQQSSKRAPLVQVADLYAGLMSHYAFNGASLSRVMESTPEQQAEVISQKSPPLVSASDRERFKMIPHILKLHQENGIAAKFTQKGMVLGNGVQSDVFNWMYRPQHELDKAPRRGAEDEVASYFYECSETGCDRVVELAFEVEAPLCGRHYAENNAETIERKSERETRREAEQTYREGSHYCENDNCNFRGTPTEIEIRKAAHYSKEPPCPKCRRPLMSLLPKASDSYVDDPYNTDLLREFELRHDDRFDRRDR